MHQQVAEKDVLHEMTKIVKKKVNAGPCQTGIGVTISAENNACQLFIFSFFRYLI